MFIFNKGVEFNAVMFRNWTREQFMQHYAGVVKSDLPYVWDEIQKANESTKSNIEPSKESEVIESKSIDDLPVSTGGISETDNRSKHKRSTIRSGDK